VIGQTLDHYRIESKLGEGGMGVVYKARDTHLGRVVAAKVLPADKVADSGRKERFAREARAASALNHPNIVTIYDIRSVNGVDFIVMEYVEGQTLEEAIPAKGMRVLPALKIAAQIADGLARAHEAGILHRDIKPSNVMVTGEGRAKILDFGLAKLSERVDSSPEDATERRGLTKEGAVVGTAAYMSPEQAEGRKLDSRSDIFSFGAVLYELVTGRKPFPGESALAILTRILNDDPVPPGQLNAAISPDLEKTILRCLRKDPARRYQSMADLKVALEDLEAESASAPRSDAAPIPVRSRPFHWMWGAVIVAVAIAGLFAVKSWRSQRHAQPPQAVALTTFAGFERYPSLSPDGSHVAFTWNGPKRDNSDIYVQLIGSGSPLRLTTDPGSDVNPVWSPDGRWIAFLRGEPAGPGWQSTHELRLIAPLGGPERKLSQIRVRGVTDFYPVYLTWCPDSSCLVVTDSSGEGKPDALFAVSLETGEKRQLTNPQRPVLADVSPAISRDARSIVFHRIVSHGFGELHVLSLDKSLSAVGEPRRLTSRDMFAEYPTWMPDSREILFSAKGSLWRLVVSENTPPERIPFVGDDGLMPVVSRPQPDGSVRLVYARSFTDENIWRIDTSAPGAPSSSAPVVAIAPHGTRFIRGFHQTAAGWRLPPRDRESGRSGCPIPMERMPSG
jgi:serine/threonine protein kinase